ncbi:hypothetical protein C5167_018004 [Papaver somniferum]|uniref:Uncharacterized protein n=1 Tax=Papaver somniferum TaxID=3469 RepID=A0A4Y7IQ12_PAPSO|nr:uncharacterized protein LOC113353324 [Papaver somniferum]RZC49578.1 hypothetical protein C5167_018004 [Papaver somniferum]
MEFSSSTVFAIVICLFGSLEMASAWRPNCIREDIYLDSTGSPPIPAGTTCKYCEDWCDAQCSILGLPPVKYGCRLESDIRCRCCCGSSPPSPSSPPSEPLPPPAPQSPDEFEGRWPQMYDICAAGQRYFDLNHKNGTECIHAPKCEQECKDKGLVMARKECVAGGYTYPRAWYEWYEQCCCETPSPPPPSLSPPPPSTSGDTCQLELSIQISPDQAPCNYKLAQSEY